MINENRPPYVVISRCPRSAPDCYNIRGQLVYTDTVNISEHPAVISSDKSAGNTAEIRTDRCPHINRSSSFEYLGLPPYFVFSRLGFSDRVKCAINRFYGHILFPGVMPAADRRRFIHLRVFYVQPMPDDAGPTVQESNVSYSQQPGQWRAQNFPMLAADGLNFDLSTVTNAKFHNDFHT